MSKRSRKLSLPHSSLIQVRPLTRPSLDLDPFSRSLMIFAHFSTPQLSSLSAILPCVCDAFRIQKVSKLTTHAKLPSKVPLTFPPRTLLCTTLHYMHCALALGSEAAFAQCAPRASRSRSIIAIFRFGNAISEKVGCTLNAHSIAYPQSPPSWYTMAP